MICIQVVRCSSKTLSLEKNQTPAKIAVSLSCCCGSMTSKFSVYFSSRGSTSETPACSRLPLHHFALVWHLIQLEILQIKSYTLFTVATIKIRVI